MVDGAPSLEAVLPEIDRQLRGRVMVAHNAPFDRRVLRQAFSRIGRDWPDPPVICTAALARTLLPLQREAAPRRRSRTRSGSRSPRPTARSPDAETCARVLCALFPRLCANATTIARGAGTAEAPPAASRPPAEIAHGRPRSLPAARSRGRLRRPPPGPRRLPVPRRRRQDPVRRQVGLDPQPRAGPFRAVVAAGAWTGHATIVDYRTTRSELGALVLENRLIKELRPAGNMRLTRRRRPARVHPLPAGHLVSDPRGRARTRPPATR